MYFCSVRQCQKSCLGFIILQWIYTCLWHYLIERIYPPSYWGISLSLFFSADNFVNHAGVSLVNSTHSPVEDLNTPSMLNGWNNFSLKIGKPKYNFCFFFLGVNLNCSFYIIILSPLLFLWKPFALFYIYY